MYYSEFYKASILYTADINNRARLNPLPLMSEAEPHSTLVACLHIIDAVGSDVSTFSDATKPTLAGYQIRLIFRVLDHSQSTRSYHHRTTAMPTSSITAKDVPHHHRRSKRPSSSLSSSSHPTWTILSRGGARRDGFPGDRTTSATTLTSDGEQVSVSLHLVEPPHTSVLTLDWPQGPDDKNSFASTPVILAAHQNLVLFNISTSRRGDTDYFVYAASSDASQRPSSLSLLPAHYHPVHEEEEGGSSRCPLAPEQHSLSWTATGILSSATTKEDSSSSSSFVVAQLQVEELGGPEVTIHLLRSVSGEWELFKNLHVHGVTDDRLDLIWWRTDAVVPYRHKFLVWVDYFRAMIVGDMSERSPELRYVPLPVYSTPTFPEEPFADGRDCPEASRGVCATRFGIKFVSVDTQRSSSFGLGGMREWKSTFRITTWSFREEDDTWRRDATVYEEEFWPTLDPENRLPHVSSPQFPVVDVEDPDVVCFHLNKYRCNSKEPTWMIKVDMRKLVLLSATASYSKHKS